MPSPQSEAKRVAPATPSGHAQTVVMLNGEAQGDVSEPERSAAANAAGDALSQMGLTVLPFTAVQLRLTGKPYASCGNFGCATAVIEDLSADYGVLVTVWKGKGPKERVVSVSVVEPKGESAGTDVSMGHGKSLTQAAQEAARQSYSKKRFEETGEVSVITTPQGAMVYVDGEPVDRTPIKRRVLSGERELLLELNGYKVQREVVMVHKKDGVNLDIMLTPGATDIKPYLKDRKMVKVEGKTVYVPVNDRTRCDSEGYGDLAVRERNPG